MMGSVAGLFPPGSGAPKPPMGQQVPGMAPQGPMPPQEDPQRVALLQALAQKIGTGGQ